MIKIPVHLLVEPIIYCVVNRSVSESIALTSTQNPSADSATTFILLAVTAYIDDAFGIEAEIGSAQSINFLA